MRCAHRYAVFNGFNSAHKSPTSADMYAIPTHHTAHTMSGAMFLTGDWFPQKPAMTMSMNRSSAAARSDARTSG
jgi:hypothetical protein